MKHPCVVRGETLDCQARHLNAVLNNLGKAIKDEASLRAEIITTAWRNAFKRPNGDG